MIGNRIGSHSRRRAQETVIVGACLLALIALPNPPLTAPQSPAGAREARALAKTPIRHVVIILKENRSFDEYFGRFPGADGATSGRMSNGEVVPLGITPDPMPNDIGHLPKDFQLAYDGGNMDGFDKEMGAFSSTGENLAYTQMRERQIKNYWAYARRYAIGDHMFANWQGASFTNNLFEVAAQAGQFDDSIGNRSVYTIPRSSLHVHLRHWGCDAPPDTLVTMQAPGGELSTMFPCFNFPALPGILQQHGLSWSFYGNGVHNALDAIAPVRYSPSQWLNVRPFNQFFTDAAGGTLPTVSWVLAHESEHAPMTACRGENESVRMVNAIMNGPDWGSTAVFTVWDEWGGFYDHVSPPQVHDGVQFGFRVPLIVISPYAKHGAGSDGGYISPVQYSFSSLLKFVEVNWGIPSLTPNDQGANDMMDFFDFVGPVKGPLILQPRLCKSLTPEQRRIAREEDPD
jgi:phospholipase C